MAIGYDTGSLAKECADREIKDKADFINRLGYVLRATTLVTKEEVRKFLRIDIKEETEKK